MLLNKLRMRNFKRFRDQEIVFQDGITGIVGNNGTGKSSIVSAVLFALYGVQGTGLDGDYIVSSFAGPQDICEVRLDFSVGGNEYAVVRRFKRRASSNLHEANLYLNQKLLASSVQKVGQEVQRVVGMGPGDFRNTIYAGQKELLALLESRAGSRKDWFMQVLGIDYLKKDSMEHLKLIVDAREGSCRELSGRLQELDAEGVRDRLAALRADLAGAEEEAEKALGRETAAAEELDGARKERDRLLSVRERYLHLSREEEMLAAEIERLQGECRETEGEIAERQRLQAELEGLALLADRYEALKAETAAMAGEKEFTERLTLEANAAEEQVREHGERRTKAEKELAALAEDEKAAAGLTREVAGWQALRERIAAMKELQPEYDALREELARMEERFAQIERRVGENRTEIEGIEEKAGRLRALEEEIGEYDALLAREEVFLRAQELARQEERCLREVDAASEEMSLLESEIAGLARQLAGMDSIEEQIESTESRKEYLTSRISACSERQETIREEIRRLAEHRAEILAAGPEGSCPTCHQGLGDHYEELVGDLANAAAAMQKALADLEGGHTRATAEHASLVAALKDLYGQRTALQRLKEQHALYSSRYEQSASVGERWRAEAEGHRAAMRALGVEEYDPAAHAALKERIRALSEKRAAADTLRGECSRLHPLQEERQRLIGDVEDHLARKEELETKISRLGFDPAALQRLEAEAQALEPSYRAYAEAQARLARRPALAEELQGISARIDEFGEKLQAIRDELARLSFDPDRYARLNEECGRAEAAHRRAFELRVRLEEVPRLVEALEAKRTLLAEREGALLRAREAVEEFGFTEEAVAAAEERVAGCERDLAAAREQRSAVAFRINSLKMDLEKETGRLSRADDLIRQQEALTEEIVRLKLTRSLIKEYADYLLQVVRDRIEEEAGRVLAEITDGRYGTVMLDDDFTVLVHDMGDDYPADRFSGGEQDDIAIALRVALSRFLAEVNEVHDSTFLIFDEIFGSQDEGRRNNLLRALRTQEAHFPQILLISHITEVQDEFSTTLMVEMGGDQASRVREFE
ncbi:chromosome segregation protein SMC [Methanoculleus sediminis]|uniref:Chromosome segregation protein SMC n=1 Tax=Methanoculleus sediminis TaxID=1550566 RepID=A0A0H1QY09_9EURY|nr:SMC family ATPase [Methanoculleus sediminis]KLK87724.1 chromosome segregation protein SMC [Methanoculleus sediminis]